MKIFLAALLLTSSTLSSAAFDKHYMYVKGAQNDDASGLAIHEGPDTSSPEIARVPLNTRVERVTCPGTSYCRIIYNGHIGWAPLKYLSMFATKREEDKYFANLGHNMERLEQNKRDDEVRQSAAAAHKRELDGLSKDIDDLEKTIDSLPKARRNAGPDLNSTRDFITRMLEPAVNQVGLYTMTKEYCSVDEARYNHCLDTTPVQMNYTRIEGDNLVFRYNENAQITIDLPHTTAAYYVNQKYWINGGNYQAGIRLTCTNGACVQNYTSYDAQHDSANYWDFPIADPGFRQRLLTAFLRLEQLRPPAREPF